MGRLWHHLQMLKSRYHTWSTFTIILFTFINMGFAVWQNTSSDLKQIWILLDGAQNMLSASVSSVITRLLLWGISACSSCGEEEESHLRYSQPAVHRRWKKQQNHFHRRLFLPTEPEYCMWSGKSMNFERVQGCQGSWTASNLIHCFCHRIQDTWVKWN